MIKFEDTVTPSPEQWRAVIMGARNPMNSWNKSDSGYCENINVQFDNTNNEPTTWAMGPNDHDLLMRLVKAGTDHRKFMRMLPVYVDITAPIYWLAELDTYKVGTVRNSCSFMHKGVFKPFDIDDFSVKDKRVYECLRPLPKKKYELTYPYETDEFKIFTNFNGHTYRVYKNGRVIQEEYVYIDNYGAGRRRVVPERPAAIYQNHDGYFIVNLSGRNGGSISLHRLVALTWLGRPDGVKQVNHKNTNKGDNSVENLEWVTPSDNMRHAVKNGLYDNASSLHRRYASWKNNHNIIPNNDRVRFYVDCRDGMTHKELAEKWGITPSQANNLRTYMKNSEYEELFQNAYTWEQIINCLNDLRDQYLETKDEKIFQSIRCLLPQGYLQKSTYMLNYEVLANIYKSRKNHKLDEWSVGFIDWIYTLPYYELITG